MILRILGEIKYLRRPSYELVASIAGNVSFKKYRVVSALYEELQKTDNAAAGWKLTDTSGLIVEIDRQIVDDFFEELGKTDIQGQEGACLNTIERLKGAEKEALDIYACKGRLYRTLGILSGLAIAIILI